MQLAHASRPRTVCMWSHREQPFFCFLAGVLVHINYWAWPAPWVPRTPLNYCTSNSPTEGVGQHSAGANAASSSNSESHRSLEAGPAELSDENHSQDRSSRDLAPDCHMVAAQSGSQPCPPAVQSVSLLAQKAYTSGGKRRCPSTKSWSSSTGPIKKTTKPPRNPRPQNTLNP